MKKGYHKKIGTMFAWKKKMKNKGKTSKSVNAGRNNWNEKEGN